MDGTFARIRVPKNARGGQKFKVRVHNAKRGRYDYFIVAAPKYVEPGRIFQIRLFEGDCTSRKDEFNKERTLVKISHNDSSETSMKGTKKEDICESMDEEDTKIDQSHCCNIPVMTNQNSEESPHGRITGELGGKHDSPEKFPSVAQKKLREGNKFSDSREIGQAKVHKPGLHTIDKSYNRYGPFRHSFYVSDDILPGNLLRFRTKSNMEYIVLVPPRARIHDHVVVTVHDRKKKHAPASEVILREKMRNKIAKFLERSNRDERKENDGSIKPSKNEAQNETFPVNRRVSKNTFSDENGVNLRQRSSDPLCVSASPIVSLNTSTPRRSRSKNLIPSTEPSQSPLSVDLAMPAFASDAENLSFLFDTPFISRFERKAHEESARFRKRLRTQHQCFDFVALPASCVFESDEENFPASL